MAVAVGLMAMAPSSGLAAEPTSRAPLKSSETARTTEVPLVRYHQATTLVRPRTEGRRFATFEAEPALLSSGSALVFEIYSMAPTGVVPRWRCVALHDVADCLGIPVKVQYLPNDEKIVLKATLVPSNEVSEQSLALAKR
jgi:hypothetical protein